MDMAADAESVSQFRSSFENAQPFPKAVTQAEAGRNRAWERLFVQAIAVAEIRGIEVIIDKLARTTFKCGTEAREGRKAYAAHLSGPEKR